MSAAPPVIGIVQPAPAAERGGNRVTALRWAKLLRRAGARVYVEREWSGRACDLVVALHARKSLDSIRAGKAAGLPLVVAGTGTDLYVDLPGGGERAELAREGLARADRIVVLHAGAVGALPAELRARARVIEQSTPPFAQPPPPRADCFELAVLAGLRAVKDPLLAARAVALLPERSRVRVTHLGAGVDPELARAAREESARNPRYEWLGQRPRRAALCLLARARALVSTSFQEGGANVLTEAFALGVPVLATRIAGATGLVGEDHPGLFPAGDARALAALIERAETEPAFLAELARRSRARAWLADPARELASWRALLDELLPAARAGSEVP